MSAPPVAACENTSALAEVRRMRTGKLATVFGTFAPELVVLTVIALKWDQVK
jgi:hypothetical protein